jgi:hypothetical protein
MGPRSARSECSSVRSLVHAPGRSAQPAARTGWEPRGPGAVGPCLWQERPRNARLSTRRRPHRGGAAHPETAVDHGRLISAATSARCRLGRRTALKSLGGLLVTGDFGESGSLGVRRRQNPGPRGSAAGGNGTEGMLGAGKLYGSGAVFGAGAGRHPAFGRHHGPEAVLGAGRHHGAEVVRSTKHLARPGQAHGPDGSAVQVKLRTARKCGGRADATASIGCLARASSTAPGQCSARALAATAPPADTTAPRGSA